ncbi:MAG: hypothetical protein MZU95_13435 [Desulfomicrobium escambiense]|nr:hypothetical protein [Desulfomicrobium escambiense]
MRRRLRQSAGLGVDDAAGCEEHLRCAFRLFENAARAPAVRRPAYGCTV